MRTKTQTWKFVGGRLCLDFVNTVGGWTSGGPRRARDYGDSVLRDKLPRYDELLAWSEAAGGISHRDFLRLSSHADIHVREAAAVLKRAIHLRKALYRIFKSSIEAWRPTAADMDTLRRELLAARAHESIASRGGLFMWVWDDSGSALDRTLWPIARCAAELLVSDDCARLRQCGGTDCAWMFLDGSRNHSRQWCDMKDCGNRAKVKRFRERSA